MKALWWLGLLLVAIPVSANEPKAATQPVRVLQADAYGNVEYGKPGFQVKGGAPKAAPKK